ncbi:hypothetical protein GGI04_000614 [Coemansia thaxteri]|uniref:Uncharacterized protein n=1 Tax=Coemansia thaxteri TaxID=2663907 RepID=A0A9W8BEV7_9FUNG|nr:hypothetical protein H4R26_005109 [Coemansia thaxteri]KAJ2009234.1 hypothetical protein GGI04_000614 [Coemansia thaxteri]KAJ2474178.1 hypothetical protein GGI02_000305 [Coemansia sp. RSA 2322]KAJ2479905.1 hypothetical protein EV174_003881 [Coemansia sp. RSA 2320]
MHFTDICRAGGVLLAVCCTAAGAAMEQGGNLRVPTSELQSPSLADSQTAPVPLSGSVVASQLADIAPEAAPAAAPQFVGMTPEEMSSWMAGQEEAAHAGAAAGEQGLLAADALPASRLSEDEASERASMEALRTAEFISDIVNALEHSKVLAVAAFVAVAVAASSAVESGSATHAISHFSQSAEPELSNLDTDSAFSVSGSHAHAHSSSDEESSSAAHNTKTSGASSIVGSIAAVAVAAAALF